MEKKLKKKAADCGNFPPPINCPNCGGRGEVKDDYIAGGLFGPSSHWTYKKCLNCNGTGKNVWNCMWCDSYMRDGANFWCSNINCEKFAVMVALANKRN